MDGQAALPDRPHTFRVYFFKGDQYVSYDGLKDKLVSGPKSIAANWPGLKEAGFDSGLDDAVFWNVKEVLGAIQHRSIYFFKGDKYLKYDFDKDQGGQARDIAQNWPDLGPAATSPPPRPRSSPHLRLGPPTPSASPTPVSPGTPSPTGRSGSRPRAEPPSGCGHRGTTARFPRQPASPTPSTCPSPPPTSPPSTSSRTKKTPATRTTTWPAAPSRSPAAAPTPGPRATVRSQST
ncbi:hemopexin repeat-containing protein [Streptomyces venezuelae]|uniref:hemopexin repeat-containing protein n=1 Tax=Streptomyces venezuelae TaxID=54571 RepID=UPI00378B4BA7